MKYIIGCVSGFLLCCGASAAPDIAPAMQGEVTWLLNDLEHSGCQFYRNGSWYDGAKAHEHLKQKYDYLFERDKIATTEDFIDKAATESSMSGKPYQVQCAGDTQPRPSAIWLRGELQKLRSTTVKAH